MNQLIAFMCMFVLLSGSVEAKKKKFYPTIIAKQDGTIVECLAQYPDKVDSKDIKFKANKDGKTQKIKSEEIKAIRYYLKDDDVVDMERHATISQANLYRGKQKYDKPIWLNVIMHGPVTLYLTAITTTTGLNSTTDRYYFCKRENEEAASMVVIHLGGMILKIGKDAFPKVGSEYFADSPTISEKIKNNETGYSPVDIVDIVKEYNSEKLAQKGN